MAIEIIHRFVSQKADGADNSLVRPSNWNDTHSLRLAPQRLIGRAATTTGDAQEVSLGSGLSFSGTVLNADTVVPGSVVYLAMNSTPTGYLKANGAAVSRTTYAALFAAIGTTFGTGNGSTTFNLPDLRGEFIRSWVDGLNGRGDNGRALGSNQTDQNASHSHTGTAVSNGAHNHTASSNNTGAHTHGVNQGSTGSGQSRNAQISSGDGQLTNPVTSSNLITQSAGAHSHTITVNSNGAHTHTLSINSTGGAEVRVRNIALLAVIKF